MRLVLKIFFETKEKALKIFNSIKPELNKLPAQRSKTLISIKNNCFVIKIISKDLIALRASINSYLKGIILANNLISLK